MAKKQKALSKKDKAMIKNMLVKCAIAQSGELSLSAIAISVCAEFRHLNQIKTWDDILPRVKKLQKAYSR